ncbi:MAG: hypothetical protein AAFO29_02900 [Actinomycetota bacterium]
MTKSPSRLILASPTTIWPLASVGAGIGLAVAAVVILTSVGAGWIAFIVGLVVFFAMASVGKGTTAPTRLIYERGGTAILRSELIIAVVIFVGVWAFLSQ